MCFPAPEKGPQKEGAFFDEQCGHQQWVPKLLVVFRGHIWHLFLGPSFRDEHVLVSTRRRDTAM